MILKRYCVHDKKREDNNMGKNHKFDVVEYWIVKKNGKFCKLLTYEKLHKFVFYYPYRTIQDRKDTIKAYYEENDFILDDYEVNYDEEYNDLKKYTEKENSLKANEFYRNDKFVYKITRIGNLFRANITAGIKKNRTTRLKGTRNDNGLLYVFIDKKKYLLAKLVYKYFGDREKIIAVGDDGVIIYRDGNKINLRIENLDYISRSEFNKTRDINKKIKHNRKSNKQNN